MYSSNGDNRLTATIATEQITSYQLRKIPSVIHFADDIYIHIHNTFWDTGALKNKEICHIPTLLPNGITIQGYSTPLNAFHKQGFILLK